jgi:HAD superfamily hydrolase (TIGR01509 family)
MRPRMLLLDFDGVVSPNSIGLQRDWVVRRLASTGGIGEGVIDDLVRSVATVVPARVSLELVSLIYGVVWSPEDLATLEREVASAITLDSAFERLVAACRAEGIPLKIVSVASSRLLLRLPGIEEAMLCPPPGDSKADPATFRRLAAMLAVPAAQTLLVDDTPMVLRAAKLAGFQTALMSGPLYDEQDYAEHRSYIDGRCTSLEDILQLVQLAQASAEPGPVTGA